jgi:hypothetical protein
MYSRSWPQKLGPSNVSCGTQDLGSITRPAQPYSMKKSAGGWVYAHPPTLGPAAPCVVNNWGAGIFMIEQEGMIL